MKIKPNWKLVSLLAGATLALPVAGSAQQDPTAAGGGKKPFVLVIIDSSASMEWTTDGDDNYPIFGRDGSGDLLSHPPIVGPIDIRDDYQISDSSQYFIDADPANPSSGPDGFGPCFVWEPALDGQNEEQACNDYVRPPWRPPVSALWPLPQPPNAWTDPFAGETVSPRLFTMRGMQPLLFGPNGVRLNFQHQPRAVTVKEVMTGSMVLFPNDALNFDVRNYPRARFGPGCWLVPRMRDASAIDSRDASICLDEDGDEIGNFANFPDYIQPYPRFQEVYDDQWRNGVMDRLGSNVIFGFAAFDGFRDDLDGSDTDGNGTIDAPEWYGELNDDIDGSSPVGYATAWRTGLEEGQGNCNGTGEPCYDLGLFRVVMPNKLDIPATMMPQISAFTQIALNDSGYLVESDADPFILDPDQEASQNKAFLGATFSAGLDNYMSQFQLGKQPIARATPLAAVMHDTYQFFAHGQDGNNPFSDEGSQPNDPYAECRPKHVVLMTDGKPEPERGDPATLSAAFGYDEDRYIYDTVENEIAALVDDVDDIVYPTDNSQNAMYGVKVHVVGLNLQEDGAVEKLAHMAMEGQTCAELMLGDEWIPENSGGSCEEGTGCLVDQSEFTSGYEFTRPGSDTPEDCLIAPALILDTTDPEVLQQALSRLFGEVLAASGLASRTRAVVANRLDDFSIESGGQYRFFSGVRIGGSDWWQGVVNRLTMRCDSSPVPQVSLDQEIATQVDIEGEIEDSRRIFTSVPTEVIWNFDERQPRNIGSFTLNETFPMRWDLASVDVTGNDEFQGTYLPVTSVPDLVGKRVPFRNTALAQAYDNGGGYDHYPQMNTFSEDELKEVINTYRGRIGMRLTEARGGQLTNEEGDRVLGGVLNSNPIVVGPPELDLPIGSYREFRAKFADRPTMLYVSSMEGMLHAIHSGELQGRVAVRESVVEDAFPANSDITNAGDASDQREAWAYMPFMLHRELSANALSQPYLFDGTPVAKDVRLCNQNPALNTNYACTSVCPGGDCVVPQAEQWRTVLVQGRGLAGAGYYAMDVTRPGGFTVDDTNVNILENPDPIALWEFDAAWEERQIDFLFEAAPERIGSTDVAIPNSFVNDCNGSNDQRRQEFMLSSFLGLSVSEPEIATLLVDVPNHGRVQRPVAVFGAGLPLTDETGCGAAGTGLAIYVVDLQTGSILRRFTTWVDDSGAERYFGDSPEASELNDAGAGYFSGSPALFDSGPGSVATRGFIGDSRGRLFRMNFLNPDPAEWEVSLFFDPYSDPQLATARENAEPAINDSVPFGPAAFKPGVALTPDRRVTVVYGLGETGDTVSAGQVQAVLTLVEDLSTTKGQLVWAEIFPEGEKLTGAPSIFDRTVYFPTYALTLEEACEPGTARVWGLQLFDHDTTNVESMGVFQFNSQLTAGALDKIVLEPEGDDGIKWWGPEEPTLIRGVTVTLGPQCAVDNIGGDDVLARPGAAQQPQLVVQTSGDIDVDASLKNTDDSSMATPANEIDRIVVDIPQPRTQSIPLSWTIINN